MIKAPQLNDLVLISSLTEPALHARVERIIGFNPRNDTDEWIVAVNVESDARFDQGGFGPGNVTGPRQRFEAHVIERQPYLVGDMAKWLLVDPRRAQPAERKS